MTPSIDWTIWPGPISDCEITILSAALQPTMTVGPNLAALVADPAPLVSDGMLIVRLLSLAENTLWTMAFDDVFSFRYRDDCIPSPPSPSRTQPVCGAPCLWRKLDATQDPHQSGRTQWLLRDPDTTLDVLSSESLPKLIKTEINS